MALDWFSGLVGYDASGLRLPKVVCISVEGKVEWQVDKWQEAPGSWSSKVLVSRGQATEGMYEAARSLGLVKCPLVALRLSGNPTKFLQGHNVFGPSVSELATVVRETVRRLPEVVRPRDVDSELWPSLYRARVDTAVGVDLGGHRVVHEWLTAAEGYTRARHGRPLVSGTTVYWGKHSRRWTIKAYCKFCELAEHRPADYYEELRAFCEGQLRLELTLRGPELKDRGTLDEAVLWEYYERLVVGVPKDEVLDVVEREKAVLSGTKLPRGAKDLVLLWLSKKDVRFDRPKATFYKYRRMILDALGVDVSIPWTDQLVQVHRIGFDLEYLRAREVKEVPEYLQGLLFKVPAGTPRWGVRERTG